MGNENRQELSRYDLFAAVHMYSYRILLAYSFIYAAVLILHLLGIADFVKVANTVLWAITTPTYYALMRGFLMIGTRGLAFGRFSESYRKVLEARGSPRIYAALLYLAMAIWVIGLLEYLVLG